MGSGKKNTNVKLKKKINKNAKNGGSTNILKPKNNTRKGKGWDTPGRKPLDFDTPKPLTEEEIRKARDALKKAQDAKPKGKQATMNASTKRAAKKKKAAEKK